MIQITVGYVMDLILGDPYFLYHPVRIIGHLVRFLEKGLLNLNDKPNVQKFKGLILLITVSGLSFLVPFVILLALHKIHPLLNHVMESIMIYQIFATRCLDVETKKVYRALKEGDMETARKMIGYLVSRDTDVMTEEDIIKAAIETIAENLGDGVIAPMFFIFIGGAPLGWYYKGVNTLDSMVGYKNDKYNHYGYFSAKWDDVLNYIPARLTALFIIIAGFFLRLDVKRGMRILARDKRNHSSPNSAYPESAAAGLLGIQLGGKASYFGKVSMKKTMGDPFKPIDLLDLLRTRKLLYMTSIVGFVVFSLIRLGLV
ncbi:cobalamin biosynthesis protein CobD [Acidaminobacter sp. JC074]|uniref:adenosylcobinamide-phosphate synthase CbiB n=1 Tax=Acidaminobacter sp. JC074 TaxID=2530199 RepID=UPI001F1139EB|nr:adenosylcobinamide-phosphate synthase CbiB [Acidaminobacter sp. JC074]MCH4889160.1 cobalamin biosynthesis protein CobD [Acidaminobacter sp. JC074]